MPLSFDDLGLGANDAPSFSLSSLGLGRDDHNVERFNRSIVAPDDVDDRTPRAVLAYIDRVLNIVDPIRTATRLVEPPAPGPSAAPTVRIARRPLPVATGTPRDIIDYIDAETTRIDTNAARAARQRQADAATVIRGDGYAVGGTNASNIPGIITDVERIQRLIDGIRHDATIRAGLNGHARAQYTRSIRKAARMLIARHGLTVDDIVARLNGDA